MVTRTPTKIKTYLGLVLSVVSIALSVGLIYSATHQAAVLGTAVSTTGNTYYVDCNAGSDSNSGISATTAWKTVAKVNSKALSPGDTVYFKGGCVFKEQLTINYSGSDGAPITFDAYGTGSSPVIDGDNIRSYGIKLYGRSYVAIRNLTVVNAKNDTSHSAGILAYNSSNIKIEQVTVKNNSGVAGIDFIADVAGAGNNNLVQNCLVSGTKSTTYSISTGNNYGGGIVFYSNGADRGNNNQITNNITADNGGQGISLSGSSAVISHNKVSGSGDAGVALYNAITTNNVIEYNEVFNNCRAFDDRAGINLFQVGSNNIIRYNIVHDQFDTFNNQSVATVDAGNNGYYLGTQGIRFDGGSGVSGVVGSAIYYNLIYNEVEGVQIYNFPNVTVANNTIYNSKRFGINLNGASSIGDIIKNNIISTLATGATAFNYKQLLGVINNTSGYSIDYNVYYPAIVKVSGRDDHSIMADPLFNNVAAHDFFLVSSSPAKDRGASLGLTQDLSGQSVPSGTAYDIGAYEFVATVAKSICTENWLCSDWSTPCSSNSQARTCSDSNNCGTIFDKPPLSQACVSCTAATCSSLGKNCGTIGDGCGGTLSCGSCLTGQTCTNNICVASCVPNCSGKTCGSNGCGGVCGTCSSGRVCINGLCVNTCTTAIFYKDADGDGKGSGTSAIRACVSPAPVGYVTNNKDCCDSVVKTCTTAVRRCSCTSLANCYKR